MKLNQRGISKLQFLAMGQLGLIVLETALGVISAINFAKPEFEGEEGNGLSGQIATLMFVAFTIPAVLTLKSAGTLALPNSRSSEQARKSAFVTQKGLFILCIVFLIPSSWLALNGFIFFAIDCLLGIILWPIIRKERDK
jgi:heme A synthase